MEQLKESEENLSKANMLIATLRKKESTKKLAKETAMPSAIEALQMELKQLNEAMKQERMVQMGERSEDKEKLHNLAVNLDEVSLKLTLKTSEANALQERVVGLTSRVEELVARDMELVARAENAEAQVAKAQLDDGVLAEQKRQLEFVLEEKKGKI